FDKWTPALDNKTAVDKDLTVTGTFTKGGTTPSDKSETPTIDQPTEGDGKITGKGVPEAEIVVKDKDGNEIGKTTVDKDGNWKVTVPADKPLKKDDVITATQTEKGKKPSDPARETVKGKVTPPYFNYLTLTLDENYRGGEITHYDVYEDELIERYLYTPRRRGYVFEGWSYRSDYLDEVRPGDRIYYSTTLYAIWSKDRYYDRDEREEEPEDTREVLEHKAYMFGYTDGTVRPNGNITRAEAAALVTRLLGIESIGAATRPMFTDTPSAWYNKAINAAVQRGIMKGYPDGRFRPNAPITRAEFTQMIAQIDNKPYGIAPFADVKGHWAELAIGREYQAKRIMGYPDGTFRPNANITRCEAVVILNKMFERNYDDMSAINAMNRHLIKSFLDLSQSFWGYNDMVEATNDHDFKRRVKGRIEEDWTLVK
ncbi:S-layer homology domain-containing protein, partial [Fenollaria timonensis]|uniref:S-layer homology domain-containing protein n=1 Tax=Fenollaria timonensis TaxID=1723384 RepID=UPI0018C8D010